MVLFLLTVNELVRLLPSALLAAALLRGRPAPTSRTLVSTSTTRQLAVVPHLPTDARPSQLAVVSHLPTDARPSQLAPDDAGPSHLVNAEDTRRANAVVLLRAALVQVGLGGVTLWGIDLTADSGAVLLRQFLRARRWSVDEARRMLQGTLRWRRENGVDELGSLASFGDGMPADRIFGRGSRAGPLVLATLPGRAAISDVKRFVRWRIAMQEAAIRTLCLTQSAPAFTLIMDVSGLRRYHLSREMRCCTAELTRTIQVNAHGNDSAFYHMHRAVEPDSLLAVLWPISAIGKQFAGTVLFPNKRIHRFRPKCQRLFCIGKLNRLPSS